MATKSSFMNMTVCLLTICLVCSALLGGVYALTAAPIADAAAAKTNKAIAEVVPAFEGTPELKTVSVDGKDYAYYEACNAAGEPVGYAINSTTVGFGGPLSLMVGVTVDGEVYNTSVLSHSETPGLGAKCEGEFAEQFRNWNPSEKTLAVDKDGGDVDAITASTITSRAYTLAVAQAVKAYNAIVLEREAVEVEQEEDGGQENE